MAWIFLWSKIQVRVQYQYFLDDIFLQISNKMISAISAHLRLATKRFLELIRNKKHVLIEASLYVYYSGSHGNSAFSFGNGFMNRVVEIWKPYFKRLPQRLVLFQINRFTVAGKVHLVVRTAHFIEDCRPALVPLWQKTSDACLVLFLNSQLTPPSWW